MIEFRTRYLLECKWKAVSFY